MVTSKSVLYNLMCTLKFNIIKPSNLAYTISVKSLHGTHTEGAIQYIQLKLNIGALSLQGISNGTYTLPPGVTIPVPLIPIVLKPIR